jgi:hypothetical protein
MYKFAKDLRQITFFGDPKQLPPFGSDDIHNIDSIFDIKHLKQGALFLNTQCKWYESHIQSEIVIVSALDRMPEALGNFISQNVYESRLKSEHSSKSPSCVAFVDVNKGWEIKDGFSWKVSYFFWSTQLDKALNLL